MHTNFVFKQRSQTETRSDVKSFVEFWTGKGKEKSDSQKYWLMLLDRVLGVARPEEVIEFEDEVHIDTTHGFIDARIPETKVLIEQKSATRDLREHIKQSDGSELTPFQQAKKYSIELPYDDRPRWIVTCNFKSILIYDMNKPHAEPEEIQLQNLAKEYYRLKFLVDIKKDSVKKEEELSIKAGELVGELFEALSAQYKDFSLESSQKSLNQLCVRLVFCLYAEDAGLFPTKGAFHDYLLKFPEPSQMRNALIELFATLNTPEEKRDQYADDDLLNFPFVNGGLFSDEDIEIPRFTEKIRDLLLAKAADNFDWSQISPTIFGSVFESTLNPETRRRGGMHYTSIENIHKIIDPLFLDDLRTKFENIKKLHGKRKISRLQEFQDHLSQLTFLDPACGSGNFLTETYTCLRRLENEAIRIMTGGQTFLGEIVDPVKVSIKQFYGIEINDFAVSVAKTALWIAESQMLKETEDIVQREIAFLPLKANDNIFEGNALRIDWNDVVSKEKVSFIMGNPPFVGAHLMNDMQKEDFKPLFSNEKVGKLDYVAGWYKKAANYISNSLIKVAFVSTNSIVQGEQVAILWKKLIRDHHIEIIFAHKTFVWNNETVTKAHVHCVIVGFCAYEYDGQRYIFDGSGFYRAEHINAYLLDFRDVYIESFRNPLSDVPVIKKGSQASDAGHLFLTEVEAKNLLKDCPHASKYIRQFYGAVEYIDCLKRYCLWLVNVSPDQYSKVKFIMNRLSLVKQARENAKSKTTRAYAKTPYLFTSIRQPKNDYLIIPRHSGENRKYIPMGFLSKDIICGDACSFIENAGLFHFGVLTSLLHMTWMRVCGGRLESRYRYSNMVYNSFPWPNATSAQEHKIEESAQGILNARAKYPNSSLSDLYNELLMPADLRKAHQKNDKAVLEAYGLSSKTSENEILSKLFDMYQKLVEQKNG